METNKRKVRIPSKDIHNFYLPGKVTNTSHFIHVVIGFKFTVLDLEVIKRAGILKPYAPQILKNVQMSVLYSAGSLRQKIEKGLNFTLGSSIEFLKTIFLYYSQLVLWLFEDI